MAFKRIEVDKNNKIRDNTRYSTKQKYNAAILFKLTGSLSAVANQTKINRNTLVGWSKQDWWLEMLEEIRLQSRAELSGNLKKIVDRAFKEVEDRVTNGDWIYDQKQGKMLRKPVGAHVANQILKDTFDRTILLEKLQSQEKTVQTAEKIQDRLLKLAVEFENFAKAKTIIGEYHPIHDERTPGLLEGTSLGTPAPGTSEAEISAEPSSGTRDEERTGA